MNNRRSFLKLIRFAPAAPLAAKAMAESALASLSGVSLTGYSGGAAPLGMTGAVSASGGTAESWQARILRFLANNQLPDWVDDHLRHNNRHVDYLDPDIASKKSWSFNVKVATQRERNIARAKHEIMDGPRRSLRANQFQEQSGVWL